ncbi:hypothetical protein ALNOE001_01560 [Candidatus Methanobinarius endosymbioticus]|uniref:Uncharacterized protein n=1 Tax=Candidatus Methanobinarius endosymbioticus TaxID=2006182 RepID=A0A366ME17_9EURY|nr:hypothetical protein ALNOE001_01560 [Candidatus Methanobinarius endosymbioticus]
MAFGITDENDKFTFRYKGSSIYFEVSFNDGNVYQNYKTRLSINPDDSEGNSKNPPKSGSNNNNNKPESDSLAKSLAMEKTGIPLIVIILVLLISLGILARKK